MKCIYCSAQCIKRGKVREVQRYQCKNCERFQQEKYVKHPISEEKCLWIKDLTCEGCGISSIGRLLKITKSSVQRIIMRLASKITISKHTERDQQYQIDELRTCCRKKANELWAIYAVNTLTGKVIAFCVGRRTKDNINKVVQSVLKLNPNKIYTDGLNIYPKLIPAGIHRIFRYCTNKIERHNLTLRTHLKRLNRKTICFTHCNDMLESCLKLYWFA